ncbi:MAG TPA: AAA family ATPase [Thermomicrobiales bacterium]|nr:AAA family ATPase [Thermomicrobiales bacterium]
MSTTPKPSTLGELRETGYTPVSVREEMRRNLVAALREGRSLFPTIRGYDDTVLPQLYNAILAGHDIIFLGERGQAKTRLARDLVQLLDPEIPAIASSEVNDDPMAPISAMGRQAVAEFGEDTPIAWVGRDRRFSEKLATPDTTVADLIGEVDPIKVAEGRYLSNEDVISFGLIPRTHRGIFNLNELPDLAERIQVGLLNILEERDIQIRGFQVRIPLDVMMIASANPEDYTNRGRIITPLKDRFGSQIRTHYPDSVSLESEIAEQERTKVDLPEIEVLVPAFMREIITEISHHARRSPDVSQRSGVSVRTTIANLEAVIANAQRRSILQRESHAVPRISDLAATYPSTMGKIEFETYGEGRDEQVLDRIIGDSVRKVFVRSVDPSGLESLLTAFENGLSVSASDSADAFSYIHQVSAVDDLSSTVDALVDTKEPASIASAIEFVLEGLHQTRKLSRKRSRDNGAMRYAR